MDEKNSPEFFEAKSPAGDGAHYDAPGIHYQHLNIVKFIPVIQRHRNVGDAHAAGSERFVRTLRWRRIATRFFDRESRRTF